ncbi:MAG: hypothetical protein IEMM0007_0602 [bacterium]|nr:MAG: hypothetical protein IEMM0007_0602 [bacterium]
MKQVTERIDPERFFRYYIVKVCEEASIDTREKFLQIEYLSKMLTGFVDPEKYLDDSGDLVRVIDVLKEEAEKTQVSINAYKKAAVKILFYQSFCPEAFKRRLLSLSFYSGAAKMFYRIVGNYRIPVCGLISTEYSLWNFILRSTHQRYFF